MTDKKNQVRRIFDSISKQYDFLNHLLSFGIDFYWRYRALKLTGINSGSILLDVACGTGDFSIAAKKRGANKIYGADLSMNMLMQFNQKAEWIKGKTVQTIAEKMPFKESTFTNIIVAFGVRNFYNIHKGLSEFFRILNNSGKVTILEFRMPSNTLFKLIYDFYFNKILPFIGKIISKDREAYSYLPASVSRFDEEVNLVNILREIGFINIEQKPLTFGIVQVVIAQKK